MLFKPEPLALKLERRIPDLKDSLITAIQGGGHPGISERFLELAASHALRIMRSQGMGYLLDVKGSLLPLAILFLSLSLHPLYIVSDPDIAPISIRRILFLEPDPDLSIYPGNAYVSRGGSVAIRVELERPVPRPPILEWNTGNKWMRREMKGDGRSFFFSFVRIERDLVYRAICGGRKSKTYRIYALDSPSFEILGIELLPPPYTGLSRISVIPGGEIRIPSEGTMLSLKAIASRKMKDIFLVLRSQDGMRRIKADLLGRRIEGVVRISAGDKSIFLEGRDTYGILGRSRPISLDVGTDLSPDLAIIEPKEDLEIERWDEGVRVVFEARDDFGISSVSAVVGVMGGARLLSSFEDVVARYDRPKKEVFGAFVLNPSSLGDLEGDSVSVRLKVLDNRPGNPNEAISPPIRISLLRGSKVHESISSKISEGLKSMEADLGIARDSVPQGVGSWNERREAREGLKSLERTLDTGSELLRDMKRILERSGGSDPATMARLERIKRVLEELSKEELRSILERLEDPLLWGREVEISKLKYEEFLSMMEKAVESLRGMRREEELRSILKEAGELISRNEGILSELKSISGSDKAGISRLLEEEKAFARDIDTFFRKIDKLVSEAKDEKGLWADHLKAALKDLEGLPKEIGMAASDLESGMWDMAKSRHRKAFDLLSSASEKIMKAMEEMMAEGRSGTTNLILSAIDRACYISKVEGDILESLKKMERDSRRFLTTFQRDSFFKELLERHMQLSEEVKKLSRAIEELTRRSLFLGIGVLGFLKELEDARSEAEEGLREWFFGNALKGSSRMVASSNRLSLFLIEALENATSDQLLLDLGEAMAQLEVLAAMQMGLSRESGEGKRGGKEIAERQRKIGEGLKRVGEILEEVGKDAASEEIGKAFEESRDVERRLEGGEDPKGLRREQERIAERMLKAYQIAFGEKEGRRMAEAAKSQGKAITSIPLPPDLLKKGEGKRVNLGDLALEGYPKAYEELVRRYFESLSRGWGR